MCILGIANKVFKSLHVRKNDYDVKYARLLSTGITITEPFCMTITLVSLGKGVKLVDYYRTIQPWKKFQRSYHLLLLHTLNIYFSRKLLL